MALGKIGIESKSIFLTWRDRVTGGNDTWIDEKNRWPRSRACQKLIIKVYDPVPYGNLIIDLILKISLPVNIVRTRLLTIFRFALTDNKYFLLKS